MDAVEISPVAKVRRGSTYFLHKHTACLIQVFLVIISALTRAYCCWLRGGKRVLISSHGSAIYTSEPGLPSPPSLLLLSRARRTRS